MQYGRHRPVRCVSTSALKEGSEKGGAGAGVGGGVMGWVGGWVGGGSAPSPRMHRGHQETLDLKVLAPHAGTQSYIMSLQSYIVTPHSAGCLQSVFLLLKVLEVLKTSKSRGGGGPAAPPHPPPPPPERLMWTWKATEHTGPCTSTHTQQAPAINLRPWCQPPAILL